MQRLKSNFVSLRNPNGLDLFALSDFTQLRNQVLSFDISFMERDEITDKTAPPKMQKTKDPQENNYVLNFIKVNKCVELKKLHVSNFTNINLAEI